MPKPSENNTGEVRQRRTREENYFLPYQAAWIKDKAPMRICEKGRQIGLSYADSYDSVRKASPEGALDVWVMSRDEIQAKQYILYCKRWANTYRLAAKDLGEQTLMSDNGKEFKVQQIQFASGASIYALSSNPDAIAGKTGHVKLDEFALHKDQRQLFTVAKPATQWGGTLSVLSTHRGIATVFNSLLTDVKQRGNPMGWSLHTIAIQRAVDDGLVEKINAATGRKDTREEWLARTRAECIDEEQWLQEYCCQPADENSAFISYDMLRGCSVAELVVSSQWSVAFASLPSLYLGVDVARHVDLCVFDLGQRQGDVMHDVARIELRGKTFSELRTTLYGLLTLPGLQRCCIDATGMGEQMAEEAKEQFGWKVEPVKFTSQSKEKMAFGLRQDFEDKKLRIPHDDKLWADLRGIKKSVTASGNIRFEGESADSHCDRFWAKALRQEGARNRPLIGAALG